jgi:hypothetical protein
MDMSRRLIGVSLVRSPDSQVCDVDIEGFVRRLLLFDKYVLVSERLEEFPHLVRYFGFEGLQELLSAKAIEIRCDCFQPGQTAQTNFRGFSTYSLFTYRFDWIDAHDRRKYIHDCLQNIHKSQGLQLKEIKKLKLAIADVILPPPIEERREWGPSSKYEILNNSKLVRASIDLVLRARRGLENVPYSFSVSRGELDTYRVSTDLDDYLKIEDIEAHRVVERGLIGVVALTQALGEMKAYSAISGFREDEVPLFRCKLDFLAETASSEKRENSFRRVIDIGELPTLPLEGGRINVEKLLRIRESSEAREFRDWLSGAEDLTDKEIRERVRSLKAVLGLKTDGTIGKSMRFLITTGVGFVPHALVPAVALSFVDQFILEKLLPKSGISAFINELYPSLFEPERKTS